MLHNIIVVASHDLQAVVVDSHQSPFALLPQFKGLHSPVPLGLCILNIKFYLTGLLATGACAIWQWMPKDGPRRQPSGGEPTAGAV